MTTDLEPDPYDTIGAPAPFISAAIPIVGDDDDDPVSLGDRHARLTYDWIVTQLAELRSHRDDINTEISRLVEAEQVWKPIVARLDSGIRHRHRNDVASATDQSLPLT